MENEPVPPPSSVPPPPDIPPPPPPSMPPPPDVPPPPPVASMAPPLSAPPPPAASSTAKFDSDEDEHIVESADGVKEAAFDTRLIGALIDAGATWVVYFIFGRFSAGLAFLISMAYFLTRDALPFLNGQSLGKKLMKTQAVDLSGKSLSGNWQASIMRNLAWVIPFFPLVEIYILYTKKNEGKPLRRLGDDWGKTKVVVVKDPAA